MKNENYPILTIQHTLKVSEIVQSAACHDEQIDLIPIAYAVRNRLSNGGDLDCIALECGLNGLGDNSSTCDNTDEEPCLRSLSIVAGVFAGLYEDPTDGATRFHRHDHCPQWSKNLQPSALLGPYLYYRD